METMMNEKRKGKKRPYRQTYEGKASTQLALAVRRLEKMTDEEIRELLGVKK